MPAWLRLCNVLSLLTNAREMQKGMSRLRPEIFGGRVSAAGDHPATRAAAHWKKNPVRLTLLLTRAKMALFGRARRVNLESLRRDLETTREEARNPRP